MACPTISMTRTHNIANNPRQNSLCMKQYLQFSPLVSPQLAEHLKEQSRLESLMETLCCVLRKDIFYILHSYTVVPLSNQVLI